MPNKHAHAPSHKYNNNIVTFRSLVYRLLNRYIYCLQNKSGELSLLTERMGSGFYWSHFLSLSSTVVVFRQLTTRNFKLRKFNFFVSNFPAAGKLLKYTPIYMCPGCTRVYLVRLSKRFIACFYSH